MILIKNLRPYITKNLILKKFGVYGEIQDVQMFESSKAFVHFKKSDDAKKAINGRNSELFQGTVLKVELVSLPTCDSSLCPVRNPNSTSEVVVHGLYSHLSDHSARDSGVVSPILYLVSCSNLTFILFRYPLKRMRERVKYHMETWKLEA